MGEQPYPARRACICLLAVIGQLPESGQRAQACVCLCAWGGSEVYVCALSQRELRHVVLEPWRGSGEPAPCDWHLGLGLEATVMARLRSSTSCACNTCRKPGTWRASALVHMCFCTAQITLELRVYVLLLARALDVSEPFMLLTLLEVHALACLNLADSHARVLCSRGRACKRTCGRPSRPEKLCFVGLIGGDYREHRSTLTLPQVVMVGPNMLC